MSLRLAVLCLPEGVDPRTSNSKHMERSTATTEWTTVTDLAFDGERFRGGSMFLEVTQELAHFQKIITQVAGELFMRDHPDRQRLPKGFKGATRLRFNVIEDGSAKFPLQAPVVATNEQEQNVSSFFGPQASAYVAEAIDVVTEAIHSQSVGIAMPKRFPRNVASEMSQWGGSLRADEAIKIDSSRSTRTTKGPQRALFTRKTRERFGEYAVDTYEDQLTVYAEVREVNKDNFSSVVRLPNGARITVSVSEDLMPTFFDAGKGSLPVKITGIAEINRIDGLVSKFRSVNKLAFVHPIREGPHELTAWAQEEAQKIDWSNVPSDLSERVDDYLYGE